MLLDKYTKTKPSVESVEVVVPVTTDIVDPAVVAAVQADTAEVVDNATAVVEPVIVPETSEVVAETLPPVETELPPANTEVVAEVLQSDVQADPVVDQTPVLTVSVEDEAEKDPTTTEEPAADAEAGKTEAASEVPAAPPAAVTEEPAAETAAPAEGEPVAEEPAPETAETEEATTTEPAEPAVADDAAPVEAAESTETAEAPASETETTEVPAEAPAEVDATESEPAAEPAEAETSTDVPAETTTDAPVEVSADAPADAPAADAPVETEASDAPADAPVEGETTAEDTAAPSEDEQVAEIAAEVEAEVDPANVEKLVQEAADADDEYADEMLQLNGLEQDDEELRASIEALEERADALQNFHSVLSDAQANEEPISPEAAGVMGEEIARQTEGLIDTNPVPSMESFMGRSGSSRAIVASLEGVGAAIETVWKWIVAAISKLIELGGKLWRKLMDDSARIQSRAENLKELIEVVDDSDMKASSTVVVSPTVAARLSIAGKPVGRQLVQKLGAVQSLASSIIVDFDASALRRAEIFAEGLDHIDLNDLDNTLPRLPSVMKVPPGLKRTSQSADGLMEELESANPMLNDAKLKIMVPSTKAGTGFLSWTQRAYAGVQVFDSPVMSVHLKDDVANLPILSVEECNDILNSAIEVAKLSRKFRGQYDTIERAKQLFIKAGQDFTEKHAAETDPTNINRVKVIVRCLHDYAKDVGSGSTQMVAYALRCSDASLRYVSACVDHHRKAEATAPRKKSDKSDD